jgi:hypothetical protein
MARRNPTAASMAAECKVKFIEGLGSRTMPRAVMTKLVEQYKTKGFQKRIDEIEVANLARPLQAISVADHWKHDKKYVLRVAKHLSRVAVILSGSEPVDEVRLVAAAKAIRKSRVCELIAGSGAGRWCEFDLAF